jgi:CHAT domain-containing protein
LAEVRRLIIVPDEFLYSLPFDALVCSDAGSTFSEFDYLGRRFEIQLVSSCTLLAKARSTPASEYGSACAAFGDPDYETVGAMAERGGPPARFWSGVAAECPADLKEYVRETVRGGWGRLPQSAAEANEIGRLFSGRVLLQKEASEKNVKSLGPTKLLHFACHGLLDGRDPMKSALVLSADTANDGYLEAREICDLNLRAELVVLSACDTAGGEMLRGEGLIGLTRAFMIAGARSVVASLWAVSDDAGKEFMVGFYTKLAAGKTKQAALAETKREFIRHPQYSAPYYWAGLVLHGD